MDSFTTYILFSKSKKKYYVGSTNNINRRFTEHNSKQTKSTKFGVPWIIVFEKEYSTKSDATCLEMKIKKRGISRFLVDQNISG